MSEAVVNQVPVLATRIDATVGLLGPDYSGFFEVGNTRQLAALMRDIETNPVFLKKLSTQLASRRDLFDPMRERSAWRALLDELRCA